MSLDNLPWIIHIGFTLGILFIFWYQGFVEFPLLENEMETEKYRLAIRLWIWTARMLALVVLLLLVTEVLVATSIR
jgi:hypothetical protein